MKRYWKKSIILVGVVLLAMAALWLGTTQVFSARAEAGTPIAPVSSGTATLSSSTPQGPFKGGDVITVTVNLTTSVASRSAQFGLSFDKNVLRCDKVTEGNFYKTWAKTHGVLTMVFNQVPLCDNAAGMVTPWGVGIFGGTGGPSGSSSLAYISFTALADGNSPVTFVVKSTKVNDDSIDPPIALQVTTVNGQVVVGSLLKFVYIPTVQKAAQ